MSEHTDQQRPAHGSSGTESEQGSVAGEAAAEKQSEQAGPEAAQATVATAESAKVTEPAKSVSADDERLAAEEAAGGGYRVQLPSFEGPLDLLLHLIQKHELDILDIPIGFVAKKYFEYIKMMEQLSIDLAADYLVMAATLALIKSKSLLPPDPNAAADDVTDDAEEEDPRAELVRRLLEYQKYKLAAEQLGERPVLGRDVFPRGASIESSAGPAPLAQLSLFKLVDAFEEVLKRAKRVADHQIDFERISISEKIGQISDMLREKGALQFVELFAQDGSRAEMIVTFLALLEMTKLRMTFLRQDDPMGPIFVELRVVEDTGDRFSWTEEEPSAARSSEASDEDGAASDETEDDVLGRSSLADDEAADEEEANEVDDEDADDADDDDEDADDEDADDEDADDEDADDEDADDEDADDEDADDEDADHGDADEAEVVGEAPAEGEFTTEPVAAAGSEPGASAEPEPASEPESAAAEPESAPEPESAAAGGEPESTADVEAEPEADAAELDTEDTDLDALSPPDLADTGAGVPELDAEDTEPNWPGSEDPAPGADLNDEEGEDTDPDLAERMALQVADDDGWVASDQGDPTPSAPESGELIPAVEAEPPAEPEPAVELEPPAEPEPSAEAEPHAAPESAGDVAATPESVAPAAATDGASPDADPADVEAASEPDLSSDSSDSSDDSDDSDERTRSDLNE